MYGPFHRRFSPTHTVDTATAMKETGELWGRGPRQAGGGRGIPAVQAYDGPLPEGVKGTEFYTSVKPNPASPKGQQKWSLGNEGVEEVDVDTASIPVKVTKDTVSE